jgi:hypothetical protein
VKGGGGECMNGIVTCEGCLGWNCEAGRDDLDFGARGQEAR